MTIDFPKIIQAEFKNKKSFSTKDLLELLGKHLHGTPKKSTLAWRVHDLKEKGAITHWVKVFIPSLQ
jgi:hypothetical protein